MRAAIRAATATFLAVLVLAGCGRKPSTPEAGQPAAAIASRFGVGIEIDYENSSSPNLGALGEFPTDQALTGTTLVRANDLSDEARQLFLALSAPERLNAIQDQVCNSGFEANATKLTVRLYPESSSKDPGIAGCVPMAANASAESGKSRTASRA